MPSSETKHVDTLSYDPVSKASVGLGVNGLTRRRTLIALSGDGHLSTIGDIEVSLRANRNSMGLNSCFCQVFQIENGGIATLDPANRILYTQMQPASSTASDPYYLVGIDVQTAKVSGRGRELGSFGCQ